MVAVFDTNIVIDALNGRPEADAEYSRYERVLISRVTWMEVLVGAQVRFAVGYLFLSGLRPLQAHLEKLAEIRLLIGSTTDRETIETPAGGCRRLAELSNEEAIMARSCLKNSMPTWTSPARTRVAACLSSGCL